MQHSYRTHRSESTGHTRTRQYPSGLVLDNKYYLRLGAHSEPASHFIVEAIRARRGLQQPQLTCILRADKKTNTYVEVVIIAVGDAPALSVSINLDPVTKYLSHFNPQFPINIGVIDKGNPFSFIVTRVDHYLGENSARFYDTEFNIVLNYQDILGKTYLLRQKLTASGNFMSFPEPIEREVAKVVKAIDDLTKKVGEILKKIK